MAYFELLVVILFGINAVFTKDSDKRNYVDLSNFEDYAVLWKHLFIKLDNVINVSEKLNQNILDLSKRQDESENRLTKLMEEVYDMRLDFQKTLDAQNALLRKYFNYSQPWTTVLRHSDESAIIIHVWNEYLMRFDNSNVLEYKIKPQN